MTYEWSASAEVWAAKSHAPGEESALSVALSAGQTWGGTMENNLELIPYWMNAHLYYYNISTQKEMFTVQHSHSYTQTPTNTPTPPPHMYTHSTSKICATGQVFVLLNYHSKRTDYHSKSVNWLAAHSVTAINYSCIHVSTMYQSPIINKENHVYNKKYFTIVVLNFRWPKIDGTVT